MKRTLLLAILVFSLSIFYTTAVQAQCSICTRTAQQLGEKPARGLNIGILYLAFTPLALVGILGYRWWKREQKS